MQQASLCTRRLLGTSSADMILVTEDPIYDFVEDVLDDPRVRFVQVTPRMTAVQKWNYGIELFDDYDAYVLGADDLWAHDEWHNEALRVQRDTGCGFVGINDGHTDGSHMSTHYLMTRDFIIQHHGGVMAIPHYRSWGIDEEATIRAKRANSFAYADRAVLEHRHWVWNAAQVDQTYSAGKISHDYDIMTLKMRSHRGYPDDFMAVIQ